MAQDVNDNYCKNEPPLFAILTPNPAGEFLRRGKEVKLCLMSGRRLEDNGSDVVHYHANSMTEGPDGRQVLFALPL